LTVSAPIPEFPPVMLQAACGQHSQLPCGDWSYKMTLPFKEGISLDGLKLKVGDMASRVSWGGWSTETRIDLGKLRELDVECVNSKTCRRYLVLYSFPGIDRGRRDARASALGSSTTLGVNNSWFGHEAYRLWRQPMAINDM
jgi:hypothetical protein